MSALRDAGVAWLDKAKVDLSYASTLSDERELPLWGACFHAEQAAEKAIKALLVSAGIDPPHSHNLVALAALLPERTRLTVGDPALAELTRWAIQGRYPADFDDPSPSEVDLAIETATDVLRSTEAQLAETGM